MKIDVKRLKKMIIIIFCIIIIVLGILLFLLKNNSVENKEIITDSTLPKDAIVVNNNYQKLTSLNTFLSVKKCVDLYYAKYSSCYMTADQYRENYNMQYDENSDNGAEIDMACKTSREDYISLLVDTYISDKNITIDNFTNKIDKINQVKSSITEIFEQQKNENVSAFFIKGYLRDKETDKVSDFNIIVLVDKKNNAFKVYPEEYYKEKEFNNLKIGDIANIDIPDEIKLNQDEKILNKYKDENFSNEYIAQILIEQYKENILYNPKVVYENLDDEYRDKRFSDYNNFLEYVEKNKNTNKSITTKQYLRNVYSDYNQYVCVDANENYYIFNQDKKDLTKFSIILDTYTVDIPQFVENYEKANEEEKAALNVNKFISAINDKNYSFAYSLLADSFKNNKFPSQEDFENYVIQNFYEVNTIKDVNCEKQGNYYVVTINISNSESEEKELKLVVNLEEGTKFEMSFETE